MYPKSSSEIKARDELARLCAMHAEGLIERWDLPPLTRRRKRKPRKPSINRLIKQAERSGKKVTSITTANGATTLRFDESKPVEATNPWLAKLEKAATQ